MPVRGRRHAAQARVGAGVDGEEEARGAQVVVELLARHAGLDRAVEVGLVHGEDAVHPRGVDGDAAQGRVDVALERGTGAEGDDRDAVVGADADDVGDLLGAVGEGHGVGRLVRQPRRRVAVLFADRLPGLEPFAKPLAQDGDGGGDAVVVSGQGCRAGHRVPPPVS